MLVLLTRFYIPLLYWMKKLKFLGSKWPWIAHGYKARWVAGSQWLSQVPFWHWRRWEAKPPETSDSASLQLTNVGFRASCLTSSSSAVIWVNTYVRRTVDGSMNSCRSVFGPNHSTYLKKKKINNRGKNGVTGNTVSKRQHPHAIRNLFQNVVLWATWGRCVISKIFKLIYFILFLWLRWVFLALHGLPSCGVCAGSLLSWLLLLQSRGSRCSGLSSCSTPVH